MTLYTRVLLFAMLFLFHNNITFAQYQEEGVGIESKMGYLRYVSFGVGATYQYLRDEAISPVNYYQVSAMPVVSHVKMNGATYSELLMQASYLKLRRNKDKLLDSKIKQYRASMDYRFLLKMPVDMRGFDIRAGGVLSAMFCYKNAPVLLDAAKVYEYALSLGLSARVTKEVYYHKRQCFLSWDANLPLVANMSRPYYLNREENYDPENKVFKDFWANKQTGSIGKYFRLNSRISLWYPLENGNALLFAYQWEYYRMKTINKVWFAEHSLSISFMFNY